MVFDIEAVRKHVKSKLTPQRYEHSIAVQKAAMSLGKRHGADWFRAGIAGLCHDICHDMDKVEQLNYLRSCAILPDVLTLENPDVWHSIAGAHYCREVLKITDEEILSAVRYHTTARRDMPLLEKVVYVADLTSEDRQFPDAPMLRKMAEKSLDAAIQYSLSYIIGKLLKESKPIVPDTFEAYNYFTMQSINEEETGYDIP